MIEAAKSRSGLDNEAFADLLAKTLYERIAKEAGPDWKKFRRILAATRSGLQDADWTNYLTFVSGNYPTLSAAVLAEFILQYHGTNRAPRAILSFNAERVLETLVKARAKSVGIGRKLLDPIERSISGRNPGRIPLYYCHGTVAVPGESQDGQVPAAVDKLVFSETEYHAISGHSFTWQSTAFIQAAFSHAILFVGVSLSDPNMRRWLSWIQSNRRAELDLIGQQGQPSTVHYWLRTSPGSKEAEAWIEASVAHLGIRIIWLDHWSSLKQALGLMIGPQAPPKPKTTAPGPQKAGQQRRPRTARLR